MAQARQKVKGTNLMVVTVGYRFWCRVVVRGPDDCWLFRGSSKSHDGYGGFWLDGPKLAHRVAFYLVHGRWPTPCCLHTCDTPLCCNPAHLYEGTKKQNTADMFARNRNGYTGSPGDRHYSRRRKLKPLRDNQGRYARKAA